MIAGNGARPACICGMPVAVHARGKGGGGDVCSPQHLGETSRALLGQPSATIPFLPVKGQRAQLRPEAIAKTWLLGLLQWRVPSLIIFQQSTTCLILWCTGCRRLGSSCVCPAGRQWQCMPQAGWGKGGGGCSPSASACRQWCTAGPAISLEFIAASQMVQGSGHCHKFATALLQCRVSSLISSLSSLPYA